MHLTTTASSSDSTLYTTTPRHTPLRASRKRRRRVQEEQRLRLSERYARAPSGTHHSLSHFKPTMQTVCIISKDTWDRADFSMSLDQGTDEPGLVRMVRALFDLVNMNHSLPAASVQRPTTTRCTPRLAVQHPAALIFEAQQPFSLLQCIKTCSTVLVGDGGEEWKVASPARNDLSNPWTSISFRRSDTTKERRRGIMDTETLRARYPLRPRSYWPALRTIALH
ncbi:hypothetical protein BD410DRAFT_842203 [Rickenella mellea]|uniref:Uncharacterized protein n=1 Tax=Rickenella mellea TaxID=50990 RepID=A0A4Y7PV62_9AGAM|nr:hypothetical protein BD410DRAFT_842203 [Rickenella mellea]